MHNSLSKNPDLTRMKRLPGQNNKKNCRYALNGFTLIEVLVSIVILGIGLLGIFSLQSHALMDNRDAYLRTQAISLAYDMGDRIRANKDYWESRTAAEINDIITAAQTFTVAAHPSCNAYDPSDELLTTCSAQEMAQYDTYRWQTDVGTRLPGGTIAITRADDPNTTLVDPIIRLIITWTRANESMNDTLGAAQFSVDVRL